MSLEDSEGITELSRMLSSLARDLNDIDVDSVLEAQVLGHLMTGSRTIPELMETIYGVRYDDDGYASCYMKVRRSLESLSSKGYVSRPLLGRSRPYRLTDFAIAKLTDMGGRSRDRRIAVVSRRDIALYAATTVVGAASLALGVDVAIEAWIYIVFAFLLGASVANATRIVGRVA